MSGNTTIKEISLGDDFGEVAVKANGIRIEIHADGSFNVKKLSPAANACPGPRAGDSPAPPAKPQAKSGATPHRRWYPLRRPQIGDEMPDGTICAGISPDTAKPFYVDQADAPGLYTFDQARDYAATHGKRLPSKDELNVLFNNKAAIGGFNETGARSAGWYWSFSHYNDRTDIAYAATFDHRQRDCWLRKINTLSLRCVRD